MTKEDKKAFEMIRKGRTCVLLPLSKYFYYTEDISLSAKTKRVAKKNIATQKITYYHIDDISIIPEKGIPKIYNPFLFGKSEKKD